MDTKLLNLHFAQLSSAWQYSKDNVYSDDKKESYHTSLKNLYSKIKLEDFSQFDENEIEKRKQVYEFFFKSLEFLNSSTLNHIPFELVKCLGLSLNEWIDDSQNFIIVTSLVKSIDNFSFDPSLIYGEDIYNLLSTLYDVKFTSRLIQINLPAFLDRDYLANVVLYHELGHFVDIKLNVSRAIYDDVLTRLNLGSLSPDELSRLEKYFPYITESDVLDHYRSGYHIQLFYNHISEYFCDLFASQYVGECSNHYLNYLTNQQATYGSNHPSTLNRVELVERFLGSKKGFVIDLFQQALYKCSGGKDLKIRFKEFTSDNFQRLIPVQIENDSQLHYLFTYGWTLWLNSWSEFKDKNQMGFDLDSTQVYHLINNLIEKSIGNYILVSNWKKYSD